MDKDHIILVIHRSDSSSEIQIQYMKNKDAGAELPSTLASKYDLPPKSELSTIARSFIFTWE